MMITTDKRFYDMVNFCNQFFNEAEVRAENNKIQILNVDRAVICVIDASLDVSIDEPLVFNANLDHLAKNVKTTKKKYVALHGFPDKKELTILNDGITITQPILDIQKEEIPSIDKLEFTASLELDAKELTKLQERCKYFDAMKFEVKTEGLEINAEHEGRTYNQLIKCETPLLSDRVNNLENEKLKQPEKSLYSAEYLKNVLKMAKFFEKISFKFSTDYPCEIMGEKDELKIKVILAPRVGE